jgi:hypothetical protein
MSNSQAITSPRKGDGLRLRFASRLVLVLIAVSWLMLVLKASLNYPGSRWVFLLFASSYVLMAALAVPKPRLYGYTFLAAFLFLGFCAKSVAYLGLGLALVEPTGAFNGSGRAWDLALLPAIAGSGAVIAVRVLHIIRFRSQRKAASPLGLPPPAWYVRRRQPVLAASVACLLTLNALNLFLALYQTGVSPRLVFPAHLSVFVEWLFVAGLAMWAATLVAWEAQLPYARFGWSLLIPFTEALASVSTLSRSAYAFRALSYVLVTAEFPAFFRARLARHWRSLFLVLLPVGFAVSLAGVSVLRVSVYPLDYLSAATPLGPSPGTAPAPTVPAPTAPTPTAPTPTAPVSTSTPAPVVAAKVTNSRLQIAARELSFLVVGRWIGIEGTMAVSSYPGLSTDFFQRALREKPSVGESGLYQRIAGSTYHTTDRYVFLTTPGAIAVLDFSGSLPAVAAGMGILTALLISLEIVTARVVGNAFIVSIVAMSVANAIAQMQFPYLFLVFLLEQAVAVAGLGLISRIRWSRDPRAPTSVRLST